MTVQHAQEEGRVRFDSCAWTADCCHADPEPLDPATDGDESTLFSPVVVRCCFLLLKLAEGALRIWLVAVAARRLIPATIAESDWTSKYSTASGCS